MMSTTSGALRDVLAVLTALRGHSDPASPSSLDDHEPVQIVSQLLSIDPADGSVLWDELFVSQTLETAALDEIIAVIGSRVDRSDGGATTLLPESGPGTPSASEIEGFQKYAHGFDPDSSGLLWVVNAGESYFVTLAAWNPVAHEGGGIAVVTNDGHIRQIGFWRGGTLVPPGGWTAYYDRPLSGDFGFIVTTKSDGLAGVAEVDEK